MNTQTGEKQKEISISRQVSIVLADRHKQPMAIRADSKGNVPTKIEILKVGMWRTPYHGDIMVTPDDLLEYVDNFDAGIGYVKETGAPIDYKHEEWDKAAGWMKRLYVEGETLFADVEWTPQGKQMLADKEFKCFSPQFYPKGRGGWMNPEDYEDIVENVVVGGGLTNIPLFKGLSPIMASAAFGGTDGEKGIIFISASTKEKSMPVLEDVLAKDVSTLTEEEKTLIANNQDKLTVEQKTKFGIEAETPTPEPKKEEAPVADTTTVPQELAPVMASLKSGESVVVKASELASLKASQARFEKQEAENIVKAHIARGALKADQVDAWTDRLVAASGDTRKALEDALTALPENPDFKQAIGSDAGAGVAASATDELLEKTNEAIKASDGKLSYSDAQAKVLRENTDLSDRVSLERKEQANA